MTRAQSEYLFVVTLGAIAVAILTYSGIAHPLAILGSSIVGLGIGFCACGFNHD